MAYFDKFEKNTFQILLFVSLTSHSTSITPQPNVTVGTDYSITYTMSIKHEGIYLILLALFYGIRTITTAAAATTTTTTTTTTTDLTTTTQDVR